MQIDRRLLQHVEWPIGLIASAIVGLGITTLYSATYSEGQAHIATFVYRQSAWALAGFVAMTAAVAIDYRSIEKQGLLIFGICVLLLIAVPLVGSMGGGARRWLSLGPVRFQPSELMKIGLVIGLAHFFHRDTGRDAYRLRDLLGPALLFGVPAALILTQPDLGSAALLGIIFLTIVLGAGLRPRSIALVLALAVITIGVGGPFLWDSLEDYQRQRIVTFLNPEADPLGAGYHIIQSKIAVGSGEFWGRGYLQGTQNNLSFLPEQHTDFIFSVYAEEHGFFGSIVLLGLYAALILRGLFVVSRAKDRFGALLALGCTAIIFWQVFINVSMAVGVMPVVGITLPLFSYGGSSLVTLMVAVGLVMNVSMRRFMF